MSNFVYPVKVITTRERGHTPEEIAEIAVNKIVYVGNQAPPVVAEQAHAFKAAVQAIVTEYMKVAIDEHNTTVANRLERAGFADLIPLLKR